MQTFRCRRTIRIASFALLAGAMGLVSCTKNSDKDSSSNSQENTASITVNTLVLGSTTLNATGSSTATSLKSLKYMISSIQVCEDLTINGTGYSGTSNCSALYSADLPGALSDSTQDVSMDVINAMQNGDYDSYQIDLMNETSRAKLNVDAQIKAGTYHYAVINWAAPIQFNAEVAVNGTTIYSKPTTSVGTGDSRSQSTTTDDLIVAPAKDGVVISPNGGTFFKFPSPFVVSEEDIDAETKFVMDLVFNPEGVIRATDTPGEFSMSSWFKGTNGAMYVPMLSLAPVPRHADDTNSKEVYTLTDANSTTYRLELYYNTADTNKDVRGASLVAMNTQMSDDAKIKTVETVDDKLDFTSTATGGPGVGPGGLIKGFVRGSTCSAAKINDIAVQDCTLAAVLPVE